MLIKKKIHCVLALLFLSNLVVAQKTKISSGKAFYEISYLNLTPEIAKMGSTLPSNATVYFRSGKSRVEIPIADGKMIIISDPESKSFLLCMNRMGEKIAMQKSEQEIQKMQNEIYPQNKIPKISITYSSDTKIIAGFQCKKATINTIINGDTLANICWYCEDLPKIKSGNESDKLFEEINGFLMEYTADQNGTKIKMSVRKIVVEDVPETLFKLPSGYKLITEPDFTK